MVEVLPVEIVVYPLAVAVGRNDFRVFWKLPEVLSEVYVVDDVHSVTMSMRLVCPPSSLAMSCANSSSVNNVASVMNGEPTLSTFPIMALLPVHQRPCQ